MPTITCADEDHATRAALPGWSASLGTSDVPSTAYVCQACAAARAVDPVRLARLAALNELGEAAVDIQRATTTAGVRSAVAAHKARR